MKKVGEQLIQIQRNPYLVIKRMQTSRKISVKCRLNFKRTP